MNTLLRFVGSASVLLTLAASALAIGCSQESSEDASSSESEINGSLGNAQACAVRDAYLRASLSDFQIVPAVPFAFNVPPGGSRPIYSVLQVSGVGNVYYVEYTYVSDGGSSVVGGFYETTGRQLVRSASSATSTSFFYPTGGPVVCASGSSSGTSGWGGSDAGWSSSSGSSSGWGAADAGFGSSGSSSGCWGAGCIPEAGPPSSSSSSGSWCWGAGCVPEGGSP